MTAALDKLAYYFGTIGIASVAAWLVAVALMALYVLSLRRSLVCWPALAVAIVGLVLANINSNNVSAIRMDFSEDIRAAKQRAAEEAAADRTPAESDVSEEAEKARQAEAAEKDNEPAEGEQPGVEEAEEVKQVEAPEKEDEPAEGQPADAADSKREPGEKPAAAEPRHDYHQRGKVERAEGMKVENGEKIPIGPGTEDQPVVQNLRMMKPNEVAHANRLDRLNLFFARWSLYLAVVVVVFDYFRRFNRTFGSFFPLPFGGRLVDSMFPKTHTVCIHRPKDKVVKKYLKRVVRKGETFIYFGRRDPWQASRLGRLPLLPKAFWPLQKLSCPADKKDFEDEFLFESSWFGRYCFVLIGDGPLAPSRLETLAGFLELRRSTRASARRTVNVLWDLETPIPGDTVERLAPLCRETNFKLLVTTSEPPGDRLASRFEEMHDLGVRV